MNIHNVNAKCHIFAAFHANASIFKAYSGNIYFFVLSIFKSMSIGYSDGFLLHTAICASTPFFLRPMTVYMPCPATSDMPCMTLIVKIHLSYLCLQSFAEEALPVFLPFDFCISKVLLPVHFFLQQHLHTAVYLFYGIDHISKQTCMPITIYITCSFLKVFFLRSSAVSSAKSQTSILLVDVPPILTVPFSPNT